MVSPLVLFLLRLAGPLFGQHGATSPQPLPGAHSGQEDERPNVILIVADDLGYGDLGCYGQSIIRTPALDRMGSEGIRFTQYYSGSPVSAPSRCVLLTGKHTGHSYIRDNAEVGKWESDDGQYPLTSNTFTLATLFRNAGYTTACIGKWGLGGPGSSGVPSKVGFDWFYGYLCQRHAHNHYPSYLWNQDERIPLDNPPFSAHQKLTPTPGTAIEFKKFSGNDYAPERMTREAEQFIRKQGDSPFFLYLPYALPHLALQAPDSLVQPYLKPVKEKPYLGEAGYLPCEHPAATYAAMVSALDSYVGRVLDALKAAGIDSNTVVIFTSDNGATFNIGGFNTTTFKSNGDLRAAKATLYEGGIRVPLIVRWPGRVASGKTSSLVCAAWDILPTMAAIIKKPAPASCDGLSLLPELTGVAGQRQHQWLYWEFMGNGGWQAVRFGEWKIVRKHIEKDAGRKPELYNLSTDPGETINVASKHPDLMKKGREIMWSRTSSQNPEWNFTPVPGKPRTGNQ